MSNLERVSKKWDSKFPKLEEITRNSKNSSASQIMEAETFHLLLNWSAY